jgi:hypothetical protein
LSRIEGSTFFKTGLIEIILPALIEASGDGCFSYCKSFPSVRLESGSRLSRLEWSAFFKTGLLELILPVSVEM